MANDNKYVKNQLAAITNGADETYYYYLSMDEYRFAAIQCTLDGGSGSVTVTIEGSVENENTPASAAYQDITSSFFGVASITASGMFIFDTPVPFRWIRVKVVANTAGADDADWTIDAKRMS